MKKNSYLLIMFILGLHMIQAKPVTPTTAKNIALSWYKHASSKVPQTVTLAYTETSSTGEALYYAFNVNTNDGWVIVSADDAAHPIIGYSTEKQFKVPEAHTSIGYWMYKRKQEIEHIKAGSFKATDDITREWTGNFSSNNTNASERINNVNSVASTSVVVGPLVQSDWNQSPYYNADCPGSAGNAGNSGAVTGCVATTMAQIMRYWSYPAHGIGSSSYCDCTSNGMKDNNGTLTANYGATTYDWSAMPLNDANITSTVSTYSAVAQLMYQCGVSVNMNYDPNGSGAWVLAADAGGSTNAVTSPCAQNSYVTYFGYNPTTIKGYQRGDTSTGANYSYTQWLNLIETDLNAGRPVQYVGNDPSQGGHTWVCDGYESNNYVHMNWGWAGSDDGYFNINNLLTTNGNFNPTSDQEILVGIEPPASVDAGISGISGASGVMCTSTFTPVVTVQNFGVNTLTVTTINYKLDAGATQTYTWTGSLTTGQTATVSLPAITTTAGTHTFVSATSVPNHTVDANQSNDTTIVTFINGSVGSALPLSQNFEASSSLPAGWSATNVSGDPNWNVVTTTSYSMGANCIAIDNFDGNTVGTASACIGETAWFYTGAYNLSSTMSYSMSFDVAYALLSGYFDSLAVYASTNCGSTWTKVYQKGGSVLSTTTTTNENTAWVPATTASNWRTEGINLNSYAGYSSVEFGFKNISGYGEWIYVDNININSIATTGMNSIANGNGINLYPNPAHDNIFINTDENTSSISVTDIIGQTVVAEQRVNAEGVKIIDISSLANGVYLVKVNSSDNQVKVIRFIKN
jgi:hypothetical protein